ncbi:MAG: hypothetical protein ACOYIH_10405 [Candidatus Fimadaptatus sp.]
MGVSAQTLRDWDRK